MSTRPFSEEAISEIKKYAEGLQSLEATAYNIWDRKLTADFEPNPSASDIFVWSKQLGFGIPSISADEASRRADEAIAYFE